ncbi:MAG TPA: hypothetical protein VLH94_04045 [Spirochaetia bacterium]|nr:hypothetical protein [Spirochaetia bacterium]
MSLSYNVVFEYTTKAGGYAGVRTFTSYKDKAEFEAYHAKHDPELENVVAQGVSDEVAQNLCALTPEICRLTAAVEKACEYSGSNLPFEPKLLNFALKTSCFGIEHDRSVRLQKKITPSTKFPVVETESSPQTEKDRLFTFIKENLNSPTGEIGNLNFALLEILDEALNIVMRRLSF